MQMLNVDSGFSRNFRNTDAWFSAQEPKNKTQKFATVRHMFPNRCEVRSYAEGPREREDKNKNNSSGKDRCYFCRRPLEPLESKLVESSFSRTANITLSSSRSRGSTLLLPHCLTHFLEVPELSLGHTLRLLAAQHVPHPLLVSNLAQRWPLQT